MFIKRLITIGALLLASGSTYAQNDNFCEAVSVMLKDAPNRFRNIRNPTPETGSNGNIYKTTITIPGTITGRFVSSMGFFYEGALKQAKTADGLKADYEKYKDLINTCLKGKAYAMRSSPNYVKGLEAYKKITFMPDFVSDGPPAPGHVALEVDYNKSLGIYTLLLYIFEK